MQGAVPQIAKGDLAVSAITLALERLLFGRQAIQFKLSHGVNTLPGRLRHRQLQHLSRNAALFGNKTSNANVADGRFALDANRTGRRNTATGYLALSSNTSLTSTHRTTFTVEFFANPTGDPSGSGEGQTFLGNTQVRTNASGTANINQLLSVTVQSGYAISSTATSPLGSTSEFSNDVTVQ